MECIIHLTISDKDSVCLAEGGLLPLLKGFQLSSALLQILLIKKTSIMTSNGNGEDAVKSLLEVPIEKPVFLSDAALTNLYNICHNVQESY